MGFILLLCLTFFVASIVGSVMLIHLGGWLAMVVAILLIFDTILISAIGLAVVAGRADKKGENK